MKLIKKSLSWIVNATPFPVVLLKRALGGVGDLFLGPFALFCCDIDSLVNPGSAVGPIGKAVSGSETSMSQSPSVDSER